jgi:hypothetical protein
MLFKRTASGAHPWLTSVLWIISAVAGFTSIALAFSVLLDPELAESGVCIFRVGTSLSFRSAVADERSSTSQVSSLPKFAMSDSWSCFLSQRLRQEMFHR